MLICKQVNYLLCDPACPHGKPHEAIHDTYELTSSGWYVDGCCSDVKRLCEDRDDWPHVRCVEVTCPATK